MFFELDGILIDTGPPHVEAERATIRTFGFDDLAEDHPVRFGHGIIPGSKMIATHYGIDDAEALLAEYLNQWKRIATAGIDLLPGADAEMRSVAAAGISIALVTSILRTPKGVGSVTGPDTRTTSAPAAWAAAAMA